MRGWTLFVQPFFVGGIRMAYTTSAEIIDLMSEEGVIGASEDAAYASLMDSDHVTSCIERAEARMNQYLYPKYDITLISNSNVWIKWCAATFSAVFLYRRRGGSVPQGLQESYEEYISFLEQVKDGTAEVPGLAPQYEGAITMSNMTIDQRFAHGKSRVTSSISVGPVASKKLRPLNINDYGDRWP